MTRSHQHKPRPKVRRCRECGCTDADCRQCIARTGRPCYWVAEDLCSACAELTVDEFESLCVSHRPRS